MNASPGRVEPHILTAHGLTFKYNDDRAILEDWSTSFQPGSMTALTGPSGRGKSTLLYLLGLMLQPQRGEITLNGQSTTSMSDAQRAHLRADCFGFVFQDAALDATRSVMDNVVETALYQQTSREDMVRRGAELLERFEVDVPSWRKPGQVSGGQAQRIALCRALVTNPSIILADEPTGNLDPATASTVVNAFADHAQLGATVIVVTHSPEVAALCDKEIRL